MKTGTIKKPSALKVWLKLLPIVYKVSPLLFVTNMTMAIFHGISWALITVFMQYFFNTAITFTEHKITFSAVIISLVWLGVIYTIAQLLNATNHFMNDIFSDKAQGVLSVFIHKKIAKLDPVDFEDTDTLDDINKADIGKNNSILFVNNILFIFTFYIPYFAFMSVYLFSLKPILAISVILVFIPAILTQFTRTKVFTKLEDKSAPMRREYEYYESCIVSREYFKETRLLGGFQYFRKWFIDSLKLMNVIKFKADIKTNLIELSTKIIALLGYIIILLMLFNALMNKEISVAAFAAVFSSIGFLFSVMEEVVCAHVGPLAQKMGTIVNFDKFLDMKERQGRDASLLDNEDIYVNNISFAYPNTERNAISDVSFCIKNGETLAIVGENGSGKSTLARLISGLYAPTYGNVFHGKHNTKDIAFRSLFENASAVFQKFQKYKLTLHNNITISQTEKQANNMELDSICKMSGTDKDGNSFPNGYDTMLSREFDGVDLSGGQWQRVAIARGFYKNHNMIILDEYTAAIDPLEETNIYNRFAEISKGKTAIIVTHRLGLIKLADKIIVLKNGKLVEMGTHNELIAKNGEYSHMYTLQSQWYEE